MQDFTFYFQLGTEHILTLDALDHILFVAALCLRYLWKDWKKVVVLVTAFTIGHSLTLALSALGLIQVNSCLDRVLLFRLLLPPPALTIFIRKHTEQKKPVPLIYFFALFFGLIHGLAFAGQFLSLEGKEGLIAHLLAFNLGIEVAQLLIVVVILLISYLAVQAIKIITNGMVAGRLP